MESLGDGGEEGVLIAPLWNWNIETFGSEVGKACSNRTFMELKFSKLA